MFIDYNHQVLAERTVGSRLDIGPYSRVGAVFNVILCGGLAGVFLWTALTDQPPGYGGVIFASALEVIFVRVCIRTFRGEFDEFVLSPDDDDDDDPR